MAIFRAVFFRFFEVVFRVFQVTDALFLFQIPAFLPNDCSCGLAECFSGNTAAVR